MLVQVLEILGVGLPYSSWPHSLMESSAHPSSLCTFILCHQKAFQTQYSISIPFSFFFHHCLQRSEEFIFPDTASQLHTEFKFRKKKAHLEVKGTDERCSLLSSLVGWCRELTFASLRWFWQGCRAALAGPWKVYLLLLDSNQSIKLKKTLDIIWSKPCLEGQRYYLPYITHEEAEAEGWLT